MKLRSDNQGFLIGDPIDIGKAVDQLRRIRTDIRDIKNAMSGAATNGGNNHTQNSVVATPNRPRSSIQNSVAFLPVNSSRTVTPNGRGRDASSGGFVSKNPQGGQIPDPVGTPEEKRQRNILSGFVSRTAAVASAATAGAEEADPTIKAFKEVSEPMMRGYQMLSGSGDKKTSWFKKILKELNLFRKDESVFNKAQQKVLKDIESKSGGGGKESGGGIMSSLGGLLGGKGLLGAGKGLLKRIPLLGALIGGVSAVSDIYETENDDTLTRGEKDKRDGRAVGGLAGSMGGMMAGAAAGSLLGPIGTVVGGAVGMFLGDQAGQIIGDKMGEWTTQLRDADIPGKIIGAWNTTTEAIKNGWDGALTLMSSAWDKTKEAADAANDFLKEKTGVDVKAEVKNAYENAVKYTADNIIPSLADLANKGADKLKQGAEWVGKNTTVGKGAKAAWNGIKSIGDIIRGGESGKEGYNAYNRGTGLGSNGHRDLTNMTLADIQAAQALPRSDKGRLMAVGKYQMMPSTLKEGAEALKLGSDTKFDEATQETLFSQYLLGKKRPQIQDYITGKSDDAQAAQIAGAKEWRSIADPRTGKTYADKGASGNKASISSDDWLSSMDAAKKQYQENLKLGLNETEAYSKAVSGLQAVTAKAPAINEAETPVATDAQANAFRKQEGKPYPDQIAAINTNNMPLYYSLAAGPGNSAPVNIASAASPRVPTFAPPPQIPEAPPIIQPLASNSNRDLTVSMPAPDVGQDVRDRGIAHIVTGGLSGRG